jgi:hypothetical protein
MSAPPSRLTSTTRRAEYASQSRDDTGSWRRLGLAKPWKKVCALPSGTSSSPSITSRGHDDDPALHVRSSPASIAGMHASLASPSGMPPSGCSASGLGPGASPSPPQAPAQRRAPATTGTSKRVRLRRRMQSGVSTLRATVLDGSRFQIAPEGSTKRRDPGNTEVSWWRRHPAKNASRGADKPRWRFSQVSDAQACSRPSHSS